jgi:hypothetical protein
MNYANETAITATQQMPPIQCARLSCDEEIARLQKQIEELRARLEIIMVPQQDKPEPMPIASLASVRNESQLTEWANTKSKQISSVNDSLRSILSRLEL